MSKAVRSDPGGLLHTHIDFRRRYRWLPIPRSA